MHISICPQRVVIVLKYTLLVEFTYNVLISNITIIPIGPIN